MRNSKNYWLLLVGASVVLCPTILLAGDVTAMNSFTAGTPIVAAQVNANFTALHTGVNKRLEGKTGRRAYAWANNATSASYTPTVGYSFNSTGGTITANRSAAGTYTMVFQGVATGSIGNVQVSSYGAGANYCKVGSWGGTGDLTISVVCYNAAGTPTDSQYTVSYAE